MNGAENTGAAPAVKVMMPGKNLHPGTNLNSEKAEKKYPGIPGDTDTDFNADEEDWFSPALSPGEQGEEEAGGVYRPAG
ncbi:MAG: hypothetical protein LBK02_04345 [Treponema sp.]|jgi:hypothetical protein|nr:hypothetical protein [Treponema sp.]